MTTTFNTMPPSALPRPARPALDYRARWRCARSRARRLQPDQARLRPGERPHLPLARRYVDFDDEQSLSVRARRSTTRSPGIGARSCPTTCSCSRAPRPRSPPTRRPSACAPGRASCAAASSRCCSSSRRRSPMSRSRSRRRSSRNIEKRFAETNEEYPRRSPAAQPAAPPQGGGQAPGRARRDALRPPRCGAARPRRPAR